MKPSPGLLELPELYRVQAGRRAAPEGRAALGQFLTPASIARYMASLALPATEEVRLLDPGAGVGSLTAAWIEEMLRRTTPLRSVHVTVCEIDRKLLDPL